MNLLAALRAMGRGILLRLIRVLPEGRGGPVPRPIESVLVVRTDDRVGNLLLTTPLLAALRAGLPQARIGLLCAARRSPAVEGTGLYDDLWKFEKRDFFRRPLRFARFCLALRRARYGVAIDAGHFHAFSFTSAALVRWCGAPVRLGHVRGEAARFLTHPIKKNPGLTYDAASKLELLPALGIDAALAPLQTALGQSRADEFRRLLGPALLLYPGARKLDHRWAPESFAAVALRLAAPHGLTTWVAWGPGEEGVAAEVAKLSGGNVLPPTDLEGLAAAFRAAALVVTNDTGPMHLAVAVGARTVAIFLSEDADRWASPQSNARAVHADQATAEQAIAQAVERGRELLVSRA